MLICKTSLDNFRWLCGASVRQMTGVHNLSVTHLFSQWWEWKQEITWIKTTVSHWYHEDWQWPCLSVDTRDLLTISVLCGLQKWEKQWDGSLRRSRRSSEEISGSGGWVSSGSGSEVSNWSCDEESCGGRSGLNSGSGGEKSSGSSSEISNWSGDEENSGSGSEVSRGGGNEESNGCGNKIISSGCGNEESNGSSSEKTVRVAMWKAVGVAVT